MIGRLAQVTLRELTRRRGVLFLLVLLPLSFYLVRRDLPGQSIRFLSLGMAWAVATLALFTASASRAFDIRLRLAGYTAAQLILGRLSAVLGVGSLIGAAYYLVTVLDQDVARSWAVALMLTLTVLVSAVLGIAVAALVPGEFEGSLALLIVVGLQMLANPDGRLAKVLPLWSTRSLGTYAIDNTSTADLTNALLHASAVIAMAALATLVTLSRRLRIHTWPTPT